jgi:hypothetical protein
LVVVGLTGLVVELGLDGLLVELVVALMLAVAGSVVVLLSAVVVPVGVEVFLLRPGLWLRVLVLAAVVVLDRGGYVGAWLRVVEPVVLLEPVVDSLVVDSPVVVVGLVSAGDEAGAADPGLVAAFRSAAPGATAVESAVVDELAEGVEFVLCSEF